MNKRGFELSINFVVMLILAIVVFSMGLIIISKFFSFANKEKLRLDEQTQHEIEKVLNDGSRVAVPFNKKIGSNKEIVQFGIGILNVLGSEATFSVNVAFSKAFRKDNTEIIPLSGADEGNPNNWLKSAISDTSTAGLVINNIQLKNNQHTTFNIGVNIKKAEKGTYIFNLDVLASGTNYDKTQKLYVEVI